MLVSALVVLAVVAAAARAELKAFTVRSSNRDGLMSVVAKFKTYIKGTESNEPGFDRTKFRAINWDAEGLAGGVEGNINDDQFAGTAAPLARGFVLYPPRPTRLAENARFFVSADDANGGDDGEALRFGGTDASYTNHFLTFSGDRLFAARGSTWTGVKFEAAGTPGAAARTAGFGVVFVDVDTETSSWVTYYDAAGRRLARVFAKKGRLSFVGLAETDGEPLIARVEINAGNVPLARGIADGAKLAGGTVADVVALDDFFAAEPTPINVVAGELDDADAATPDDDQMFDEPTDDDDDNAADDDGDFLHDDGIADNDAADDDDDDDDGRRVSSSTTSKHRHNSKQHAPAPAPAAM